MRGAPGLREFMKWYYPQIRKEELVVQTRSNHGPRNVMLTVALRPMVPDGHRSEMS